MSREASPIDVIEAAYDLEAPREAWFARIAAGLAPILDGGRGIMAYEFDLRRRPFWVGAPYRDATVPDGDLVPFAAVESTPGAQELSAAMHVLPPQPLCSLIAAARASGFGDLRETMPNARHFFRGGIVDAVSLRTIEPGGVGVLFCGLHSQLAHVSAKRARLWARVAAHVAAGRRLRALATAGAATDATPDTADAVIAPTGRVAHASPAITADRSARTALRDAVARQERARGRTRTRDPEAATEAWTALVSGRWSLVDHYERGGRRYLIARKNPIGVIDPRALTSRERTVVALVGLGKSTKLVAYELGLAESTVSTYLAAAMRKLDVSTRVELVRLFNALAPADRTPG